MNAQLSADALGKTAGLLSGAFWLVAMVLSLITSIGEMTLTTLGSYHPFFSYTWLGMIIIVIEHLIAGYVVGWIFAKLYNKLSASKAQ